MFFHVTLFLQASGFKIEITNTNASNVMVGLRVHLGMRSLEKTPTYIEVFGRVILLRLSRNRWFDIPFTKPESLTADKKITVTCTYKLKHTISYNLVIRSSKLTTGWLKRCPPYLKHHFGKCSCAMIMKLECSNSC